LGLDLGSQTKIILDITALHKVNLGMDESVRKYLAEIGRKGGKANKGKATEKCRLAAQARWAKYRAQQKEKEEEPACPQEIPAPQNGAEAVNTD
jgi:hypothetical protein